MAHDDIIALLEALCERPFAEDPASDPAVLRALCREAAVVLATDAGVVPSPRETEQLTASLAALIAGRGSAEERAVLIDALSRSAELRLNAESAHVFVDRLERAPRTAPADLVEEVLAEDADAHDAADDTHDDEERHDNVVRFAAAAAAPAARAPVRGASVRVPPPRMWPKAVAACAVLMIAGGAAFTIDWPSAWHGVDNALRPAPAPVSTPPSAPAQAEPAPAPPPIALGVQQKLSQPAGDSLDALAPAAPAPSTALPKSGALSLVPAEPSSDASPSLDANTLRAAAGRVRGEARATDAPPPQPVATIAVTGKPAQPCLPDVNAAAAGAPAAPSSSVIAARVDANPAPPPTQCDTAPTDRFADRPANAPDAAKPSVKTRRVLRPALTAAPVDDAMRQLVAPTPLAGRPPPDASDSAPAVAAPQQ